MYKRVIYIKECRPLTTIQYEQHILHRNTKIGGKENGKDYKLGGSGTWILLYSDFKISFTD